MTPALHHLAFRSDDVETLAAFYAEMFGLRVCRSLLPRALWLALGGEAVLMIEKREDGEAKVATATLELAAFAVDAAQRDAIRQRARERGCYDGETAFTVYLRDPEGRRVGASSFDLGSAIARD